MKDAILNRNTGPKYNAVEQLEQADLLVLETQKPEWNEELAAWTLNFAGRVKMASKKNFLLSAQQGNESMENEFGARTTLMRFGKVSKDRYALDYRYPLSPMQVSISSCICLFIRRLISSNHLF